MANFKERIQQYFANRAVRQEQRQSQRAIRQAQQQQSRAARAELRTIRRSNRIPSSNFAAGLKSNIAASGVVTTQGIFIFLSMGLFVSDLFTKFNGIDFVDFIKNGTLVWQIFKGALFAVAITVGIVVIIRQNFDRREIISWVLVITMFYMSAALTRLNYGAIIHLGFALAVLILYLYPAIQDKATANLTISIILFLDFFGFSLFGWLSQVINIPGLSYAQNRVLFPFWTIFLVVYPPYAKKTPFVKILTVFFFIFYMVYFAVPNVIYGDFATVLSTENIIAGKEAWNQFVDNGRNIIVAIWTGGERGTQQMIKKATGPYYQGVVDENEEKPLGVYIEDIKPAYPYFYFDDEVILDAQVNVNALSEPVYVSMGCKIKDENGTISPDYYPESPVNFDIAKSESILTDCTFNPGLFDQGTYTAIFTADFNFVTYGYLQRYFIDETTARTTPVDTLLNGYEKNLVSHSTGGPVKITMTPSGESPIIRVKPTTDTKYRFGFDIQNNWPAQEGKIKGLNDVIILIPDSMRVREDLDGYDCSHKFIDASVSDCLAGCEGSELCEEVCEIAFDGHRGYRIDPIVLEEENRLKDIEDSRTFSCEVEIPISNRESILGETVPNVLEFRVIAKYDYRAEAKSSPFQIKLRPGFNVFIEPVKATSSDDLTCKGIHTEKNVNKAVYQFFEVDENNQEQAITELKSAWCDSKKKTCIGEIPKKLRDMIIRCKMTATTEDGEEEFDSRTIKIRNSPPIVEAYFEPRRPYEGDTISCVGNVTDEDNDAVEVVYTIENIDEYTESFRIPTDEVDCTEQISGTNIFRCNVEIQPENVIFKRRFKCKLVPHDDSGRNNDWGKPDYAYATVRQVIPETE